MPLSAGDGETSFQGDAFVDDDFFHVEVFLFLVEIVFRVVDGGFQCLVEHFCGFLRSELELVQRIHYLFSPDDSGDQVHFLRRYSGVIERGLHGDGGSGKFEV